MYDRSLRPIGGKMGRVLRALARAGAVGGTARWAARIYHRAANQQPESLSTPQDFIALLIKERYGAGAAAEGTPWGHTARVVEILTEANDSGQIRGVAHLITLILAVDSGLTENFRNAQLNFAAVVLHELLDHGLPDHLVLGPDTSFPRNLRRIYLRQLDFAQETYSRLGGASAW